MSTYLNAMPEDCVKKLSSSRRSSLEKKKKERKKSDYLSYRIGGRGDTGRHVGREEVRT